LIKGDWPRARVTGFSQAFFPFGPYVTLALLLLLVGSPIGFLRLHDGVAFHVSLLLLSMGMVFCIVQEMMILWPVWLVSLYGFATSAGEPLLLALGPRVLADFPNRSRIGAWFLRWRRAFYAPLAALGVIGCLGSIQDVQSWENGFWRASLSASEWIQSQAWITFVLLIWSLGMVAALLFAQRRETRHRPETRLRVVEAGFLAWALVFVWILFAPTVLLWQWIGPEGQALRLFLFGVHVVLPVLLIACLPIAFAYAVFARRAFGIRFIVRRGLQHLLLSRGVSVLEAILLFVLVEESIRHGRSRIGTSVPAVAGIAAGTAVFVMSALARVNRPLMRRIDRRFFRESYDARRILVTLGERISLLRDREEILTRAGVAVGDALHPARIAFYLCGPDSEESSCAWSRTAVSAPGESRSGDPGETTADEARGKGRHDSDDDDVVAGMRALESGKSWADLAPPGRANAGREGAGEDHRFELLVPLRSHTGIVGCMALAAKLSEEPYSGEDKDLLTAVCSEMGLALENAELLEVAKREAEQAKELDIARRVQQNLFPKVLPEAPGWEFAAVCRPARAVGGDYYDLFAVEEGQVAIAIGDVAGKGLGPSMLMSSAHTLIRTRLRQKGATLPLLMSELNEHLYASTSPEMFLTLFVGVLDVRSGLLSYVNGGHNPPLLLRRAGGEPLLLDKGGTIVGIVPGVSFEQGEILLEAGDLLALFSDGVTEAMEEGGEMFGEEHLASELAARRHLGASETLGSILASVDRFAGRCEQADDISLIVVRRERA
jgi:sigma-B regulation protein RsbU (phosphoserine phosphatase)